MACDFRVPLGMTLPQRKKQVEEALDRLEAALATGQVKVKISPSGSIVFDGAWDRKGISDACAYRKLLAKNSSSLRMAVVKAEAMAGRKVDAKAVASGEHSHDSGKSWYPGHK